MTEASIIIVAHGQRAVTERCLESVEAALADKLGTTWELVLVDNCSPDDTPDLFREWSSRATVQLLDANRNFSGGCNLGAELARGQALVFLNNDTEVPPGALEALVEQLAEPGVAIVGCRLLFPDGTVQHAGVTFSPGETRSGIHFAAPQHPFYGHDSALPATRGVFTPNCVTAACMAVRRDVFEEVGGFYDGYRNGFEDVDLCLKVREAGYQIVYRGDIDVVHHEGVSRGRGRTLVGSRTRLRAVRHNEDLLAARWAPRLQPDNELAKGVWGARVADEWRARKGDDATVVIMGAPGSIGPWGDEARALLLVFAEAGVKTAAYDNPAGATIVPTLQGKAAQIWDAARERQHQPGSLTIYVAPGEHVEFEQILAPAVLRLGSSRTRVSLASFSQVWACSAAVATELVSAGAPEQRVRVVLPPVPSYQLGSGGQGVLAVLPVQRPDLVSAILVALKNIGSGRPIRLLPNVYDRRLHDIVRRMLPAVELLAPCSDEAAFAQLAASADLTVAVDPADVFDRRCLIAAQTGSAVITGLDRGPAATVLGGHVLWRADAFDEQLHEVEMDIAARTRRHASVASACGAEAFATAVSEAVV